MKLLRKRDIPEEKYTNAFLGYGPEDSHFVIELTYSKCVELQSDVLCLALWLAYVLSVVLFPVYGVDKYDIGAGFGHFGIAVDDVSLLVLMCFAFLFCVSFSKN